MIVCVFMLCNGFVVIGESVVVLCENFDVVIGQCIVCDNVWVKIWVFEGYLLCECLFYG